MAMACGLLIRERLTTWLMGLLDTVFRKPRLNIENHLKRAVQLLTKLTHPISITQSPLS
ncbi:hypothetical protein JHK82_012286 [Glycine max]|nr:hypothetical protein JHK85_012637 [Glycine max]KAG5154317.1 hypothetical protein JHK82_012286 [Glycine max]